MIRLLIIDDHEMVREGLKAMLVTESDFSIVGDAANAAIIVAMVLKMSDGRPSVTGADIVHNAVNHTTALEMMSASWLGPAL